ncbi:Uma2 family endonuclease [Streptantibioticus ferralitis]
MPAIERPGPGEDELLAAFFNVDLSLPEGYRAELIEGEIVVSPPPDGDHEDAIGRLLRQVARQSTAELYGVGTKGIVTPLGHFIPDATIGPVGLFRGMESWSEPDGIVMTVEVTSTHPNRDRDQKRRGYAAAGIPFYLLVDRSKGEVTLFSDPGDGDYRQDARVPFGKPLDLPTPFGFTLDTSIFT